MGVVDVGRLRSHDVKDVIGSGSAAAGGRCVWVLLGRNEQEAHLELLPVGDINNLNEGRAKYHLLDVRAAASGCKDDLADNSPPPHRPISINAQRVDGSVTWL